MRRLPAVGSSVVVSSVVSREKDGNMRRWVRDIDVAPEIPRRGIVTGYSHRCDGVYVPACGGHGWDNDDYEPPFLAIDKKHLVILVRFSAWGPEQCALIDDVSSALNDGWSIPSTRGESTWESSGGLQARAHLRDEMSAWPRDRHGRWVRKAVEAAS